MGVNNRKSKLGPRKLIVGGGFVYVEGMLYFTVSVG